MEVPPGAIVRYSCHLAALEEFDSLKISSAGGLNVVSPAQLRISVSQGESPKMTATWNRVVLRRR